MRRKIPSLQALICFESAARHASYTYAAQELFLTQSAVSRQIQQLEEYLGTALFTQRTGTVNTRRHYASRPRRYFKTGRSAYVCDSLAIT